jgi:hypothetical protein
MEELKVRHLIQIHEDYEDRTAAAKKAERGG